MEYLIDTHVCLWAISDKDKLSQQAKDILEDSSVKILVSQLSLLEIAIKLKTGKLQEFRVTLPEFIDSIYSTGFEILNVKNEHMVAYSTLSFHPEHRDPFDRYLLAAAYFEKAPFVTKDDKFQLYTDILKIVW